MDKSLGTLLRFWGVFKFKQVQPLPSPHKQCWARVSRMFFRTSILYSVRGGRTARKFPKGCTVPRGNREMTEKYEHCSTITRTFVQDCSLWQETAVATFKNTFPFCMIDAILVWLEGWTERGDLDQEIRSLSKDVFERRKSTGSKAFTLFICLDANKFVLLSFFSLIKTIYLRIWTKPLRKNTKSPLPVDIRRLKTLSSHLSDFSEMIVLESFKYFQFYWTKTRGMCRQ